jgi:hypothetical protein
MATPEFTRAGDSGTRSRRPRSQIFCRVPVVQEGRGVFPEQELSGRLCRKRIAIAINAIAINLIRLRAMGIRSLARALRIGGCGGRRNAIGAAGQGTRSGQCQRRDVVSATASDTTASRHHPASAITLRDLTARDYAVDAEPTRGVRCAVGAMARALTPGIDPVSCPPSSAPRWDQPPHPRRRRPRLNLPPQHPSTRYGSSRPSASLRRPRSICSSDLWIGGDHEHLPRYEARGQHCDQQHHRHAAVQDSRGIRGFPRV